MSRDESMYTLMNAEGEGKARTQTCRVHMASNLRVYSTIHIRESYALFGFAFSGMACLDLFNFIICMCFWFQVFSVFRPFGFSGSIEAALAAWNKSNRESRESGLEACYWRVSLLFGLRTVASVQTTIDLLSYLLSRVAGFPRSKIPSQVLNNLMGGLKLRYALEYILMIVLS